MPTTVAAKPHPASAYGNLTSVTLGTASSETTTVAVSDQPPTTVVESLVLNAAYRSGEKSLSSHNISSSNGALPIASEVPTRTNDDTPVPLASREEERSALPVGTFPTEVPDYSADFSSEHGEPHRGEDASLRSAGLPNHTSVVP